MKFIDIHSNILQNIDDGSKSVEMAIELLKESTSQNVETVVLIPHYDAGLLLENDYIEKEHILR